METEGTFDLGGTTWWWWLSGCLDVPTGRPDSLNLLAREVTGIRVLKTHLIPTLAMPSDQAASELCQCASELEFRLSDSEVVALAHGSTSEWLDLSTATLRRLAPISKVRITFGGSVFRTKEGRRLKHLWQWRLEDIQQIVPASMRRGIHQAWLQLLVSR